MKKIIISSLLIGVVSFGCSKKRTCTETTTHTNGSVDTNVTMYDKLTPKEKKDVENLGTYTQSDGTAMKTSCK